MEELIEELLAKEPNDRPFDALAVQVKLAEIRKKVAEKKTVVGETAGAEKGVTMQGDAVVTKALNRKKKRKKESTPVWERGWFLGLALLVIGGGGIGLFVSKRFASEEKRWAEVQSLTQSGQIEDLLNAELVIKHMQSDFPEGPHKNELERMVDDIGAIRAERNLNLRLNIGKDPETEGERLWVSAKLFEKNGDRVIALEKYRAMENLLRNDEQDRPFRSLARRQAENIEKELGGKGDRTARINQWLKDADAAYQKGNRGEAQKDWKSIVELYGNMPEFGAQVQQANDRLARPESANPVNSPPAMN
jgi:serine/threonine-protein kinase